MVSRIRARVWIQVRYWLVGWPEARTVEFSEEEYFDEEAFWPEFADDFGVMSMPRYDEIADYLPVPRASLRRTELTLASSRADEVIRHLNETYWENATCRFVEIIHGDVLDLIINLTQRETPATLHILRHIKHPRLRDRVLDFHVTDTAWGGVHHETKYLPVKGETTLYEVLTEEEKNGEVAKPCTEQEGLLRCYVRGKPEPYFWSTEELPTDDGHNDVTNPPTWLQRQAISKLGVSRADIRRIEYTASNRRVRKMLETVWDEGACYLTERWESTRTEDGAEAGAQEDWLLTLVLTQRDTPHVRHVLRYGVLPSGKHGLLSHVAHNKSGAQLEERVSVLPFGERGSVSHVAYNKSGAHRQTVYYTLDESSELFEDE